jgi:hypothetical protein
LSLSLHFRLVRSCPGKKKKKKKKENATGGSLTAVALLHTKLIETDQTRSKLPFCSKIYNPVHFNTRLGIENRNKFNRDEGNATG